MVKKIWLSGKKGTGKYALVDDKDYEELSRLSWYLCTGYAMHTFSENGRMRAIYMHRKIMGLKHGQGLTVDHVDGNPLNNTRENLRVCTHQQNCMNVQHVRAKSGYKGVKKYYRRWRAEIKVHGKMVYLGSFDTPEDAARAYDGAATKHFGEFACLNFPDGRHPTVKNPGVPDRTS